MILKDHPEIAKLLVEDKPYTIIIALAIIVFMLANCYWSKVTIRKCRILAYGSYFSMPILLEDSSTTPFIAASTISLITAEAAT
jgi:hypothetical protein